LDMCPIEFCPLEKKITMDVSFKGGCYSITSKEKLSELVHERHPSPLALRCRPIAASDWADKVID
jgi:hypothetical protein